MKNYENKLLKLIEQNNTCYSKCSTENRECKVQECRLWIDYPEDYNCTEISVQKNDKLVLREVGERLKLTPSRVKQIESEAIKKLFKTMEEVFADT
jgi:DNA-directed RNA polymerase specialized sigma subunit